MGLTFRGFLNKIGIENKKLVDAQTQDLHYDNGYGMNFHYQGLYLSKGDAKPEVKLLQLALRQKITGVLSEEDLDLCRSILGKNIEGVNSQQYDFLISTMNNSRAINIANSYAGLDDYELAVKKMHYYTRVIKDETKNWWAPIFISYIMLTSYPSWRFAHTSTNKWFAYCNDKDSYVRRIKTLSEFRYEKVYLGMWTDSKDGHMFLIDPIRTVMGEPSTLHSVEGNTYKDGSYMNHSISKRIRKYHAGSAIKIFEVTV